MRYLIASLGGEVARYGFCFKEDPPVRYFVSRGVGFRKNREERHLSLDARR